MRSWDSRLGGISCCGMGSTMATVYSPTCWSQVSLPAGRCIRSCSCYHLIDETGARMTTQAPSVSQNQSSYLYSMSENVKLECLQASIPNDASAPTWKSWGRSLRVPCALGGWWGHGRAVCGGDRSSQAEMLNSRCRPSPRPGSHTGWNWDGAAGLWASEEPLKHSPEKASLEEAVGQC